MSNKWNQILDEAKEETRKELRKHIRNISSLSDTQIDIVAPTDRDKSYFKDLLDIINNNDLTTDEKIENITMSSGSYLVIDFFDRFILSHK